MKTEAGKPHTVYYSRFHGIMRMYPQSLRPEKEIILRVFLFEVYSSNIGVQPYRQGRHGMARTNDQVRVIKGVSGEFNIAAGTVDRFPLPKNLFRCATSM
jgi:hypothetical protein